MQAGTFKGKSGETIGYYAHKVRVNSNISTMNHSVWFSPDGDLTGCEAIDKMGRSRPVSPKVRKVLETMFGWVKNAANRSV